MGLQCTKKGTFELIVKLTGNYTEEISFDSNPWKQFQENIGLMSTYLNGSSKIKVNPISFANIFVSFISAYGAKAILVTRKEDENFPKKTSSTSTVHSRKQNQHNRRQRKESLRRDGNAASYILRNGENNQMSIHI